MAWARQPDAPQIASSPLDVLEPKDYDYKSLYEEYICQGVGAAIGFIGPCIANRAYRRPIFAGIWNHLIAGTLFTYAGLFLRDLKRNVKTKKDDALRQYINLHPEDFPPYKEVLYKDVLLPWHPVR